MASLYLTKNSNILWISGLCQVENSPWTLRFFKGSSTYGVSPLLNIVCIVFICQNSRGYLINPQSFKIQLFLVLFIFLIV